MQSKYAIYFSPNRFVNPSIDKLLSGMEEEKQRMYATGKFDRRIEKIMRQIKLSDLTQQERSLKIMD